MNALDRALASVGRHLIPFVFVLYVVAYLDRVNVSYAATTMSRDLGMGTAAYGFGAGIFFLGYVLLEVPSNLMLQRVGARKWISRILLSWGVVAALMAFITTPQQFYALRLLLGIAEAGLVPGIILFLSQWVPSDHRTRTLTGFVLAIPVAGLLGGPISAALLCLHGLAGLAGWRWLFLFEALPALVLSLLVWCHLPNHPHQARWLSQSEADALEAALEQERLQQHNVQVQGLRAGLRQPAVWLLSLLNVGIATGVYGFSFWIPRFVADALPMATPSPVLVNLISAIPYGMAVIAMLLVAASADRHQQQTLHVSLPLALGALALGLATVANGPLRLVLIGIATAAVLAAMGPFWSIPAQFLSGPAAAAGIAMINAVGNLGGFVAPMGMGLLLQQPAGEPLALTALATVVLLSALLARLIRRLALPSVG